MNKRNYSLLDQLLMQFERGLQTVCAVQTSQRPNPALDTAEPLLTQAEHQASAELMRVNHTGEVCAQALYYGQMVMAQSPIVYQALEQAALEETDHLAWTSERLQELNTHRSYLNAFWYSLSFLIGLTAGTAGDRFSLGFIEETERQVSQHLKSHLNRLPVKDLKSRQIVTQMREDEQRHGAAAARAGAKSLPLWVQCLMSLQAKVMTITAAKL